MDINRIDRLTREICSTVDVYGTDEFTNLAAIALVVATALHGRSEAVLLAFNTALAEAINQFNKSTVGETN